MDDSPWWLEPFNSQSNQPNQEKSDKVNQEHPSKSDIPPWMQSPQTTPFNQGQPSQPGVPPWLQSSQPNPSNQGQPPQPNQPYQRPPSQPGVPPWMQPPQTTPFNQGQSPQPGVPPWGQSIPPNQPYQRQLPQSSTTQWGQPLQPTYPSQQRYIQQSQKPPVQNFISPKKGVFGKKVGCVPLWVLIVLLVLISLPLIANANNARVSTTASTSSNIIATSTIDSYTPVAATPTPSPTPNPTPTPTPSPTPVPLAKVGSTLTYGDISCILISVSLLQGDGFLIPKAGNSFIVVRVKLINGGSDEYDYNEFDFHVKTGTGNVTDPEVEPSTYTANDLLNSGKLVSGGSVTGDIVLEAPIGDHQAELSWQPNFFGNATDNVWLLGL